MKTLVVGANGQIGRMFCTKAHEAGFVLRAMVRDGAQVPWFAQQGIEAVVGDLEGDFGQVMDGCEQVVFTAGSGPKTGPDKTLLVDLYGAIRTIDEAKTRGVQRLLMVSAMRAMNPQLAPAFLRPYAAAKYAADHYMMHAGLPYLRLLPGRLTDEPATGRIRTAQGESESITISRENVALCMVAALRYDDLHNKDIILLDGEQEIETTVASFS